MKKINEILEFCERAKKHLTESEMSPNAKSPFDDLRLVAFACLDGSSLIKELNENLSTEDRHNLLRYINRIKNINTLSRGAGQNQEVKEALNGIINMCDKISPENKTSIINIFYSWQSRLPNSTNRSFIEGCIERSIKRINNTYGGQLILAMDADTRGIPGTPDIVAAILNKIDASDIFIADISIVNEGMPNSNVLLELGYALKSIGSDNVILIMNEFYGGVDKLPFDLGQKRVTTYNIGKDEDKTEEREKMTSIIEKAITLILEHRERANKN